MMTRYKNLTLTAVLLLLLAVLPTSNAFLPSTSRARPFPPATTTTSTTLYYRDDVPPIGSAPKWDTPNDFDQFLTQCTIQSFTFLLTSLRDDPTVRWLDDFTEPVFEKPAVGMQAASKLDTKPAKKKKVSLLEAAQSALLQTEQDLMATKTKKVRLPSTSSEETSVQEPSNSVVKDIRPAKPASTAHLTLLEEKIATKTAFASFAKAKLLAINKKKKVQVVQEVPIHPVEEDTVPPPPSSPIGNTGVSELYSSGPFMKARVAKSNDRPSPIVPKDSAPPKKTYSPFSAKKTSGFAPVPETSPLYGGGASSETPKSSNDDKPKPSIGEKKNFAPYGSNKYKHVKPTGGFAPVPTTSSLYGGGSSNKNDDNDDKKKNTTVEATQNTATPKSKSGSPKKAGRVLKYHGLGILNNTKFPTWETYFERLLEQPKEFLLVESPHPNRPPVELDIDPAALCRRMISVRTQLAEEFVHDLDVIANMGGLTLQSYHKMLRETREQRAEEELQQQKDALEKLMPKSLEDSLSNHGGATSTNSTDASKPVKPSMQRANLLFLDRGVGEGDRAQYAPSPLRKGNFDLLCLLATQEAIHRVLNDPSRQARKSAEHGSNQFLQDFYVTRLLSHFSGDQRYGRSDDFLEELLECPPRMITVGNTNDDDKPDDNSDELTKDLTYLVDPVQVAETILNEREVVALQWKQHLLDKTKENHMAIQKMVLAKVMGSNAEECEIVDPEGNDIEDDLESCFE